MIKIYKPTKIIGIGMMIVGFGGLALILGLFLMVALGSCPFFVDVQIVSAAIVGITCCLRRWKPSLHLFVSTLVLVSLTDFLYYRYYTPTGVLARYNVYFNDDATNFDSSSFNEVIIWFEDRRRRLPELSVMGDVLSVGHPYRTADGHLEFVVQSGVYPDRLVRIQLLTPPDGERAFAVVDAVTSTLNITYLPQKLRGTP